MYFCSQRTARSPIGTTRSFWPFPWRMIRIWRSASRSYNCRWANSLARMPVESTASQRRALLPASLLRWTPPTVSAATTSQAGTQPRPSRRAAALRRLRRSPLRHRNVNSYSLAGTPPRDSAGVDTGNNGHVTPPAAETFGTNARTHPVHSPATCPTSPEPLKTKPVPVNCPLNSTVENRKPSPRKRRDKPAWS